MTKKFIFITTLLSVGLVTTSQAATVEFKEVKDDITLRESKTFTITADEPVDLGAPYGLTTGSISIFNGGDHQISVFLELEGGAKFDVCYEVCKIDANFDGEPYRFKPYKSTGSSSTELINSILTREGESIYARKFFAKELLKPQVIKIRMPIYPNKSADYTFTIKESVDIEKAMSMFPK